MEGMCFGRTGAHIKVAPHGINLCHICQIHPSLGISVLPKKVPLPNLPHLYFLPGMTRDGAKTTPVPSLIHEKYFHNQNAQLRIKRIILQTLSLTVIGGGVGVEVPAELNIHVNNALLSILMGFTKEPGSNK